jgi:hypothetical protein
MSDAERVSLDPHDPRCERCEGDLRLLTILPCASDHPTFRIFECVSCDFVNWIAEKIA